MVYMCGWCGVFVPVTCVCVFVIRTVRAFAFNFDNSQRTANV